MKEFIFIWNIENISYSWHKKGECIVSPVFHTNTRQNIAWTLKLYPRGTIRGDYLSLYLCREINNGPLYFKFNLELSCISADKSALHSSFSTLVNDDETEVRNSYLIKRYELFEKQKALYLPNDILTLRCRMWEKESGPVEYEEIFARTQLITEKVISVKQIKFDNNFENTFDIRSDVRHLNLMSVSVVYVEDQVDVRMDSNNEREVKFSTCKMSFVDTETDTKLCEYFSCFFGGSKKELWWLTSIDTELLKKYRNPREDIFEFITEIIYSTGEVVNTIEQDCRSNISEFVSKYMGSIGPNYKLTDGASKFADMWNLCAEKGFCDVEMKTQNKSFFVHKTVLCTRSPVFLTMLTGEMKEKIKGCIEIKDISDKALEMFLKFLYTDSFEALDWDVVFELYYAADKYEVERLKCLCRGYLIENVNVNNVCKLLILADRHNDRRLRRKLCDFVWENETKIFISSLWKKFACEYQKLALQTMLSKYEEKENHRFAKIDDDDISSISSIQDDFRSLYEGQIVSDVVIKSEGSTFPAHKTVLCANSSSFQEMLKDKSTDVLDLLQWEDDTISRMLSFLYTDSLEDIKWDSAMKLYQVASAHEIQRLQIKCSCFLLENINMFNASNLLRATNESQDSKLKAIVEYFILIHSEQIFPSDEWANFSKANLLLANETMIAKYKQAK